MKLLGKFGTIFDRIVGLLAVLGAALCVILMAGVTVNVVLRYFFSRPIPGAEEVSEYILLWLTFLGTAWVLKKGKHVRIDIKKLIKSLA